MITCKQNIIMITLAFFYSFICSGQDLKKKTVKIPHIEAEEIYYVLKSNKDIKHGEYKIKDAKGLLKVIGQYNNNQRIGKWEYYDEIFSGTAIQKIVYDYDNQKVLFHGAGSNLQKTTDVKQIQYQEIYDFIPPFCLDTTLLWASRLYGIFELMEKEKINVSAFKDSIAYIELEVHTNGEITVKRIVKSYPNLNTDRLKYFVELVLPTIQDKWIPKTLKDGTTENASVLLPLKYN
jgi:hypothetical protein